MLAESNETILQAARTANVALNFDNLNLGGLLKILIPVTLGNIIGGSGFVGLVYWFIYLRK